MQDIGGKVAVITGGASGIGYAMAERLARAGARIVLGDVEQAALDTAVARLGEAGHAVTGLCGDVARLADVQTLADHAAATFGPVHILCNNAGVSITGPTWALSMDDWRWIWDVNVLSVVHGINVFLPGMMAHGERAHVVNTGSLASFTGVGGHAPYCSSKAAVLGISQALYSEMKAMTTNVGVSIVCPGMVATRIHQSWRNRPAEDTAWSDRETADAEFQARSDAFQGAGIAAADIAGSVLDAILADRFYVFTNRGSERYVATSVERAVRAENPFVVTWGEDNRPEEARGIAPWLAPAEA